MNLKTIGAGLLIAAAIEMIVDSGQPVQALTIYSNRTVWQTALDGATITTDTFSNSVSNAPTIVFDSGVTSTGSNPAPDSSLNLNGIDSEIYEGYVEGESPTVFAFSTITWSFSQDIVGFGADWFSTATGDRLTVMGNFDGTGNQTVNFFSSLGAPGNGFLGVIGTAPFSSITFGTEGPAISSGIVGEAFRVDNLSFAAAPAKPIPTPALLPGFIGLGIATLRKRKQEKGLSLTTRSNHTK